MNLEQLKELAKEKGRPCHINYSTDGKKIKAFEIKTEDLDEIVTSTYLQAVWEMGAWIEEQDFARKVAEKTGNAEAVYEMQDVIKKIQTKLQSLKQTKDDD